MNPAAVWVAACKTGGAVDRQHPVVIVGRQRRVRPPVVPQAARECEGTSFRFGIVRFCQWAGGSGAAMLPQCSKRYWSSWRPLPAPPVSFVREADAVRRD